MSQRKQLPGLITGLVALIATACFMILGFATGAWHLAWMVFLAVPITGIITDVLFKKEDKTGAIVGMVAILAAGAFFLLGFLGGFWHPGWLVFLLIPLTASVIEIIKKRNDVTGSVMGIVAVAAVITFFLLGWLLRIWYIAWVVFLLVPMTGIIINIVKAAKSEMGQDNTNDQQL